jgi:hypothetical protein
MYGILWLFIFFLSISLAIPLSNKNDSQPSKQFGTGLMYVMKKINGTNVIVEVNRTSYGLKNVAPVDLVWRSNEAGIYSHFFELKYLLPFTYHYGKKVWIEPIKSNHYGMESFRICDYLDVPGLNCLLYLSKRKCTHLFQQELPKIRANDTNICIHENIYNRSDLGKMRYAIYLQGPRLIFQPKFQAGFLELLSLAALQREDYLVVHWRRGDQLTTRCKKNFKGKGLQDTSVNCQSVDEFLKELGRVRLHYRQMKMLIVTNEKDENQLGKIRQSGYPILCDIYTAWKTLQLGITKVTAYKSTMEGMLETMTYDSLCYVKFNHSYELWNFSNE